MILSRNAISLVAVLALLGALFVALPTVASADTAPPDATMPKTVSTDVLPTPQINGVVWTQAVVGDRVYVGGDFTKARPFGAAAGTQEVARKYLLAYDINTGALITSFAPVLDGQVLALRVSPDQKTLYVGGSFQKVDGQFRVRLAAFDAATGALKTNFQATAGSTVRALTVSNSTVYFGGDFTTVGNKPGAATVTRRYLAAADVATGAIKPWNPSPDRYVRSMTLNPDQTLVVVGGHYTTIGGQSWYGMSALDPVTAVPKPWAASAILRDGGPDASMTSLTADAGGILVTGYTFSQGTFAGNFEGVARLNGKTGAIIWMADCRGDHHSAFAQGGVVYTVSHIHRCPNITGGFDERWPRVNKGGEAYADRKVANLLPDSDGGYNFSTQPGSAQLDFWPDWYFGTYTPSDQGAWNVTGNDKYIVFGGEFIGLQGVLQQGLTRMARTDLAPNKKGGFNAPELKPTVVSYKPGEASVAWQETYDSDNRRLTYKVYRNFTSTANTPVFTGTGDSAWNDRNSMSFIDKGLTVGKSYDYLVIATDPFGNSRVSARTSVTIATTAQVYGDAVVKDSPAHYFRFTGTAGTLTDLGGSDNATSLGGVSLASGGPTKDAGDTTGSFNGTSTAYSATLIQNRAPNTFTVEAWVKTTDSDGGRILGYSTNYKDNSYWADRHLYLDVTGKVRFGVDNKGASKVTIVSPGKVNDGKWHHVAASLSSGGMKLYVDGDPVASNTTVVEGRRMAGSWRIGKDAMTGWSSIASNGQFTGQIDEVAVYPRALTSTEIKEHYTARLG